MSWALYQVPRVIRSWPCSPRAWFKLKRVPHSEVPRSGELGHILAATTCKFTQVVAMLAKSMVQVQAGATRQSSVFWRTRPQLDGHNVQVHSSRGHARQEHGSNSSRSHTPKFRVLANSATSLRPQRASSLKSWPCSPRAWCKFKRVPHTEVPRSWRTRPQPCGHNVQVHSSRGHARQGHGSSSSGSHTPKFRVLANPATVLRPLLTAPLQSPFKVVARVSPRVSSLISPWNAETRHRPFKGRDLSLRLKSCKASPVLHP
jgi:hypothetical protein